MNTRLASALIAAAFAVSVLPVAAQTTSTTPVVVNTTCLASASDALTQALSSAMDSFSQAMKTAYATRNTAYKAALYLTGKARREAVTALEKQFRKDSKQARTALVKARNDAWKQHVSARKACSGSSSVPKFGQESE